MAKIYIIFTFIYLVVLLIFSLLFIIFLILTCFVAILRDRTPSSAARNVGERKQADDPSPLQRLFDVRQSETTTLQNFNIYSTCKFCSKFAILLKIKHLFRIFSIRNLGKQNDRKCKLKLDGSVPKYYAQFVIFLCFNKIFFFFVTYCYSINYKTIYSYFFILSISFVCFMLVFSNTLLK